MKCPSCQQPLPVGAPGCPACGMDLAMLRHWLGADRVDAVRLVDPCHLLRVEEACRVEARIDELERRFPQCAVTVFIGPVPDQISPGAVAFWMLNHASLMRHGRERRGDMAVALVLNPAAGQAGMAVGYALEWLLPTEEQHALLKAGAPLFSVREYRKGIQGMIERLEARLRAAAKRQLRRLPEMQPPGSSPLGLEPATAAPESLFAGGGVG